MKKKPPLIVLPLVVPPLVPPRVIPPLVPPKCDLTSFPFLPIEIVKFLKSREWVLFNHVEKVAFINLLLKSWHEIPSASLPDDDVLLTHLSGVGRKWGKIKEKVLSEWVEELVLTSISSLDENYSYPRSKKEYSALQQLQSVCIFTTDRNAHYWLTPYLMALLNLFDQHDGKINEQDALTILEKVDNTLSLTIRTQKEASYLLAQGLDVKQESFESIKEQLNVPQGTAFKHYWFQKLEYTLWKAIKFDNLMQCRDQKQFKAYRITSKNSVEHIHPQKEKYSSGLGDQYLHAFGNLALLSPSQNSEYSNKPVRVKRADFYEKPVYDSLKLKNLFDRIDSDSKELDINTIIEHQKDMLNLLEEHYKGEGVKWSV